MGIKSLIIDGIEYVPKPTGGGYGCLGSLGLGLLFLLLMFGGNDNNGKKDESKSSVKAESKSKSQSKTDEGNSNTIVWENETDNSSIEDSFEEEILEINDGMIQEDEESIDEVKVKAATDSLSMTN